MNLECCYLRTASREKITLVLHSVCLLPPPGNMHVSLAEALKVRGGPLQEEEIWAILTQSAESLQELFRKGKADTDRTGLWWGGVGGWTG